MTEESMPYRHSEPFMGEESILYNADVDSSGLTPTQNDISFFCHTLDLLRVSMTIRLGFSGQAREYGNLKTCLWHEFQIETQ